MLHIGFVVYMNSVSTFNVLRGQDERGFIKVADPKGSPRDARIKWQFGTYATNFLQSSLITEPVILQLFAYNQQASSAGISSTKALQERFKSLTVYSIHGSNSTKSSGCTPRHTGKLSLAEHGCQSIVDHEVGYNQETD